MALVTTTEMFKKAYDGGYAIGAFNVNNMEIVQGITEAARDLEAPLILQVSKGARAYANHTYLVKLVEAAVIECPNIPIALHLDHGPDFETCKSCIDGGFTSVMIDASSKPFAENIEITKKVVEYAHDHGVVVEAELGALAGIEDDVKVSAEESHYTHPEEVQEFVRMVNEFGGKMPDAVGIPEEQLRKAARSAVCKINIDSDLRLAMTATIREYFAGHPGDFDPRQYLKPARAAIKELVSHKIVDVLGCDHKA